MPTTDYSDDYATCSRTYATFRVYLDDVDPDDLTRLLGIQPTKVQRKGQFDTSKKYPKLNGWFLSTKEKCTSRDSRRHIDLLLLELEGQRKAIDAIRAQGGSCQISCFWASASGHGGPIIPTDQMRRLAALDLELWFDIYMGGSE
ncbi:DUF4279 domain-containing protein [Cerasicoccus frondis]|uniref:DUF4279 domain-containing protein n=1 Tax=Cerasicoccus frondis TaxID=490090 RepID=UPI0028528089|nr:DUF4279 domain-containing protein [Cerasicoccus frondis]